MTGFEKILLEDDSPNLIVIRCTVAHCAGCAGFRYFRYVHRSMVTLRSIFDAA